MAEVGLLPFARVALPVATLVLPPYRTRFSKHQFTQPQLLAVLCLMRYENWTFREAEVRLREHHELRAALQLPAVPDYTTLYRFLRRLEDDTVDRGLQETVRRLRRRRHRPVSAAIDGTGLSVTSLNGFRALPSSASCNSFACHPYKNCRVYTNNSHCGTLLREPVQGGTPLRAASAHSASLRYPFPLFASQPSTLNCRLLTSSPALHWSVTSSFQFMTTQLPSLVILGRPNVGKSTLFNRLTGTRRSIVTNEPGITRDRIYGKAEWRGRALEIVDTGGIVPDDKALIPQEILRQAHVAIKKAALLVLVVDSQAGLTPLDEELARLLRTTGKPFVIAVNKVDAPSQEANAGVFHRIGVPIFPIAAEHGTGVDDLLDEALKQTEVIASVEEEKQPGVIEVAIIGRPNVGKSTLLNRMVGEERSIVSPIPGTTMDNVDLEITHGDRSYLFVDTAGIRRKGKTTLVAEKLSVVMARRGLERCDVALLVVDGEQGVTQGDAQIASYAEESGRSVVIVINKWDLAVVAARAAASRDAATTKGKARRAPGERHRPENLDPGRLMFDYEKMIRAKLKFLSYAPIVFLSAKTGERADKLFPLINQCWEARQRRIPTPALNNWLKEEVDLQRGTTPGARPVRIYYITQAKIGPPTFLIFSNQKAPLHFSYERFLENQLRAKFDFVGTPIRFIQRLRKRDEKSERDEKSSRGDKSSRGRKSSRTDESSRGDK